MAQKKYATVKVMKKILIVENEQDLRETLKQTLAEKGYGVLEASNGSECLEIIQNEDVDLVLLDILMPVMDGIQVLEELKDVHESPMIIILTNKEDLETLSKIVSSNIFKYIIKADHSLDDIVGVVKEALGE